MVRRFFLLGVSFVLFLGFGCAWGLCAERASGSVTEREMLFAAARRTAFDNFVLERRLSGGILAPDTIWTAFDKDKGLADARYRGKRIDVRGRIKDFAVENKKLPTMYFAAGPKKQYLVICTFEGEDADIFNGLSTGRSVTIVGICAGRVGNNVIFKNCKVKSRE